MSKAGDNNTGIVSKAQNYFSECVDELRKVARPTMSEARQATLVTVALMIFVALTIALFDLLFKQLMKAAIF